MSAALLALPLAAPALPAASQTLPPHALPPSAVSAAASALPGTGAAVPAWLPAAHRAALSAALPMAGSAPAAIVAQGPRATAASIYDSGHIPAFVTVHENDANLAGIGGTYYPAGVTATATNAFFQPLGQNGRACITCHQPPSGMSISLANIRARAAATHGTDPLFAPVDGANCPSQVAAGLPFDKSHSLLLDRGLIRIFLPVATQTTDTVPQPVEYTIKVIHDPNGCNTDPAYTTSTDPRTGAATRMISVYRRPIIAANLHFATLTAVNSGILPPFDGVYGTPLAIDPYTGLYESGNIMWDGREPTLQSQAIDAIYTHSQATTEPTDAQIAQIVDFENGMFAAQSAASADPRHLDTAPLFALGTGGAQGGPTALAGITPGQALFAGFPVYTIYDSYTGNHGETAQDAMRRSIQRGQYLFNNRLFLMGAVGSFNVPGTPPIPVTCGACHTEVNNGAAVVPDAQEEFGTTGSQPGRGGPDLSADLPIFSITCTSGHTTFFDGQNVITNDPGLGLITGRCSDIGRINIPQLRALAAHPPYFHDGSAATLGDVMDVYNKRFSMKLTPQEKLDFVNFLNAL